MDGLDQIKNLPKDIQQHIKLLERMRRDFVANVSHELRTPLTVFRGYLEALIGSEEAVPEGWGEIFQQMLLHSSRMENIIADLLLLSRIESDELQAVANTKINVAELLIELEQTAKEYSGSAQHVFEFNIDDSLVITGELAEIKSAFSNLIINAVKYTPEGGKIIVSWLKNANQQAEFSVLDTGIGVECKYIPRLTERFYRVDKARSRDSGGTGLGLAIVKHVLLRHNAQLEIESELGVGSCFRCIFPS